MRWAGQPQSHFIDEYHLHFRPALFPNALCAEDLKEQLAASKPAPGDRDLLQELEPLEVLLSPAQVGDDPL